MIAMLITMSLMIVVFTLMRENQWIFTTQTGVTAMNENVRAASDLLTREIQAAGTGLRGFEAPILGVDGEGDAGDRLAILLGDPYCPVASIRAVPGANGSTQVTLNPPEGATLTANRYFYIDDRAKPQPMYAPGDLYVLYNGPRFVIVKIASSSVVSDRTVVVSFQVDRSNPKSKFGDYRFQPSADISGAFFARLDDIVSYRYDRETETLERRENRSPWAAVARGIIGFQVRYRLLTPDLKLTDPVDEPPEDRDLIRSVVVQIRARTPDAEPGSKAYRETSERLEITPRNMRIVRTNGDDAEPPS